jgi:CRISPR-associated protein Cas1
VALSFLSEQGHFLARVHGPISGNVLLRRAQYRRADDEAGSVAVARAVLAAKFANSRTVLQRALRDRPECVGATDLQAAVARLEQLQGELSSDLALESLRGMEGDAAKTYFGVFDHLITTQKEDFYFRGRNRRPPLDNLNAMLSFVYTLLAHDASGALQAVGLDPQVGFLHRERPGRPSLALDLMEEFRPFLADRLVLSLINLRQVQGKGFTKSESGAVLMNDATRKEVLVAYQKRKQEEIVHPFLEEKTTVGLLVHLQALLLARFVRGDLDGYPPFVWR